MYTPNIDSVTGNEIPNSIKRISDGLVIEFDITKPEYQDIIYGNPFVDQWVPYHPIMDNLIVMEGGMGQDGICDIVYSPYFSTQRLLSYMHNGEDKIDLELQ